MKTKQKEYIVNSNNKVVFKTENKTAFDTVVRQFNKSGIVFNTFVIEPKKIVE